jgi:hypothetical protein
MTLAFNNNFIEDCETSTCALRSRDTPIVRWDIVDLRHQMITYLLLWPFWCAGSDCTLRELIEDADVAAGHAN